jgi:CheY-like chemotaxis protein
LKEQGYNVIGVTLKVWPQDCISRAEDKCCGPQAVMDARSVCHKLGLPYYLVDEAEEFQKQIINYFAEEYKAGRTPNPCVMCNEKLKFGTLINRAKQLGADFVATGAQAIAIVQTKRYGLILMDLMLPGMDGYDASRQIRRIEFGTGRHTPIVAVTAVEPSVSRPACIAAGIDGFISKPIEPDALAEVLQRWIFRRREERSEARP